MTESKRSNDNRFTLNNVRLSFPHIWEKARYNGEETKFEATLLIPKSDTEQVALIKRKIKDALLAKYGSSDKIPKGATRADRMCLRDGDEVDYDGYAGHWSFKAANGVRPLTKDRDKSPVTAEDGKLYAGCYCDAVVEIWVMDNQYGRRINANLYALRHRRDGEPFGAGSIPADVEDDFEDLEDEEGEYASEDLEDF